MLNPVIIQANVLHTVISYVRLIILFSDLREKRLGKDSVYRTGHTHTHARARALTSTIKPARTDAYVMIDREGGCRRRGSSGLLNSLRPGSYCNFLVSRRTVRERVCYMYM
jgi:hypothetical protein